MPTHGLTFFGKFFRTNVIPFSLFRFFDVWHQELILQFFFTNLQVHTYASSIDVTGGRFDPTGPLACLSPFPVCLVLDKVSQELVSEDNTLVVIVCNQNTYVRDTAEETLLNSRQYPHLLLCSGFTIVKHGKMRTKTPWV